MFDHPPHLPSQDHDGTRRPRPQPPKQNPQQQQQQSSKPTSSSPLTLWITGLTVSCALIALSTKGRARNVKKLTNHMSECTERIVEAVAVRNRLPLPSEVWLQQSAEQSRILEAMRSRRGSSEEGEEDVWRSHRRERGARFMDEYASRELRPPPPPPPSAVEDVWMYRARERMGGRGAGFKDGLCALDPERRRYEIEVADVHAI